MAAGADTQVCPYVSCVCRRSHSTANRYKDLEKEQRDLAQSFERESYEQRRAIERLAAALERLSEREEAERRILKLELENQLLRQERSLPPASHTPAAEAETSKSSDSEKK